MFPCYIAPKDVGKAMVVFPTGFMRRVITSPTIHFHVRQKPVLQVGQVLPAAVAVPFFCVFQPGYDSSAKMEQTLEA